MNAVVPLSGQMPAVFAGMTNVPDMNAAAKSGIGAGFAVVGYKGKNWRLKYGGEDTLLKDARGVPMPSLEVVIVGVSQNVSKIWYERRYTEGDDGAPDCTSTDGIIPDAGVPKKQATSCAACPRNQWGSRVTEAGKKAKDCQDGRRIAVIPAGDLRNEAFGGPMLLRIPPMSLGNLASYSTDIGRFGAQPFMVKTELAFNYDVSYPELTFKALGWITDPEDAAIIKEQMASQVVERILYDTVAGVSPQAAAVKPGVDTSALAGGPPPVAQAVQPSASATTVVAEPEPAPEVVEPIETDEEREAREFAEFKAAKAAREAQAAKPAKPAVTKTKPAPVAASAPVAAPFASVAKTEDPIQETAAARQQIQQAPDNLEAAIADLLN